MNAPTSLDPAAAQPPPIPVAGSRSRMSGSTTRSTVTHDAAVPGLTAPRSDTAVTVPLDAFAKRGGPDVAVSTTAGMVRVHAVFQVDPTTREMTVSVVDEAGKLVRMIPPDSVAQMIAAMAAYRGR